MSRLRVLLLALCLAGYIKLDHKVNDIQGCDFVTPAKLICASDDDY